MDKEYIDRDAAVETFKANCVGCESYGGELCTGCPLYNALLQLDMIPAADVAPVVHSKWEICCDGYYPYCKNCGEEPKSGRMTKFCPNCGAKMKEEQ